MNSNFCQSISIVKRLSSRNVREQDTSREATRESKLRRSQKSKRNLLKKRKRRPKKTRANGGFFLLMMISLTTLTISTRNSTRKNSCR